MNLFQLGNFTLHSGQSSLWKIECDALTAEDWKTLALMAFRRLPFFGAVEGVPRGGIRFANALRLFANPHLSDLLLITDDVFTTGASMEQQRAGRDAIGVVAFARAECPAWIMPLSRWY